MPKIIYDVIQRFEVENAVPRLVSTNIQVIEGGEDLLSLATSLLRQLGFYEKFDENRTSQYVGYKLKNPGKRGRRYQLVLAPRKEDLCISISQDVLKPYILQLEYFCGGDEVADVILGRFWIFPSKEDLFLESMQYQYPNLFKGETSGSFILNRRSFIHSHYTKDELNELYYGDGQSSQSLVNFINSINEFDINSFFKKNYYLVFNEDKLFPYTWQVCISSREALNEFLIFFAKIMMEQY